MPFASFGSTIGNVWSTPITYEHVVDMWLTSGTLTEHAVGQQIIFDAFGAGGGGERATGDVGQHASGGGGGSARKTITSAVASYTITLGTAGSSGTGGTATSGGNTTVADAGGTVCQANGGGKGTAGNPTATAGPGGTGGVGDVTRNGGNGVAIASTSNAAGGGCAGSASAAALAVPGDPEGSPGYNSAQTAMLGAGGAVRNSAAAQSGGGGRVIATYRRPIVPGYPYVVGVTYGRDTANLTTRNITIPGTHQSGDRLLVVVAIDGDAALTSMTGYTELLDQAQGATTTMAVYVRDADGADPIAIASASEQSIWMAYRIRNAAPVSTWDLTSLAYTTAITNPPSHTHAGGVKPILWFVGTEFEGSTNNPNLTAFPSGYGQRLYIPFRSTAGAMPALATCMRRNTAATEDPGAFTHATRSGVTFTMAIPFQAL